MILPVNLDDLLHCRTVESARVEFKAAWDARTTGHQVLKTLCAFANDFHNLNGGYVVIGVEERDGRGVLPPRGLAAGDIEAAGKWIRGRCKRIDPVYQPVLSPEVVGDSGILVLWAPASDNKHAVYHRGYDVDTPEPTKVHVHSDRMEIVSYPGPVPGVEAEHLLPGANVPAAPARNRRIGEFLKEAGLAEGRLTGLAKVFAAMERNGSPPPIFEFDAGRTYFRATLPKHRAHLGL